MSLDQGIINGAEADTAILERWVSTLGGSGVTHDSSSARSVGSVGGAQSMYFANTNQTGVLRMPCRGTGDTNIPWEEFLIEGGTEIGFNANTSGNWGWYNGETMVGNVYVSTSGQVIHRTGGSNEAISTGTTQDTSSVDTIVRNITTFAYFASFVLVDASVGHIKSWIHNLVEGSPTLDSPSINTQGNSQTEVNQFKIVARDRMRFDDLVIRPRCILVDNNGGGAITGTPTLNSTCTGATGSETFQVYGWQTDSSDSESGSGDPNLPGDTFRLFIKKVSFGPDESAPTGFVDNEEITVPGLTGGGSGGNVFAHVPHGGYKFGLTPGSMFIGPVIAVPRLVPDATGTNNSAGTLGGGASDRQDALVDANDGKHVEHSAASERVTVNIGALANQSEISEVIGISVVVTGLNDGAAPNAVAATILDNSTDLDGDTHALISSDDSVGHTFDTNAAGGQITKGAGAGGMDSMEIGYVTGSV